MFVSFCFSLILAWLVPFNASASYRGPLIALGTTYCTGVVRDLSLSHWQSEVS